MMKRAVILLIAGVLVFMGGLSGLDYITRTATALAQPTTPNNEPNLINYQGFLTDDNQQPINGPVALKFELYANATGGSAIWTETHSNVRVGNGNFAVMLGSITPISSADFADATRYLQIGVNSGTGFVDLPRQQLAAVPYALRSAAAANVPWDGLINIPAGFADGIDDVAPADAVNRSMIPADTLLTPLDRAGVQSSITIGADGLGLISYHDVTNRDLKVAHCNDIACSSATLATIDTNDLTGFDSSIAIGADGLALISYYDQPNYDLKVAHCNDLPCSSASVAILDSAGIVGIESSVTIGADGLGLISYYDNSNNTLKVAHCNDIACSSASLTTLDSIGGRWTSITLGADGLGLISYWNALSRDLRVAHCNNITCSSATLATIDRIGEVGWWTSVTIGADGLGLISYQDASNRNLKVAHCNDIACSSASLATIDSGGDVGWLSSITIGADGLGIISYYDDSNRAAKVAHCNDSACSRAILTNLDTGAGGRRRVVLRSSVTIGTDGLPLISYTDPKNGDLKVAHCSSSFCAPYFRRR